MPVLKVYPLDDDGEDAVRVFSKGRHVIGRGKLNCNDKRVSRNHAVIDVTDTSAVLEAIHINPCFYKASNGRSIEILPQNCSKVLNDGDTFALLADRFWFKVQLAKDDTPDELNASPVKRSISNDHSESSKKVKLNEQDEDIDTQRILNNIQQIMHQDYPDTRNNSVNNSDDDNSNLSVDLLQSSPDTRGNHNNEDVVHENNSPQKPVTTGESNREAEQTTNQAHHSEEPVAENVSDSEGQELYPPDSSRTEKNNHVPENTTNNEVKTEKVSDSESEVHAGQSSVSVVREGASSATTVSVKKEVEDDSSTDVSSASGCKPNIGDAPKKTRRDRCWYGTSCYRRNPAHRADFSHPGDPDYDSDSNDDRPDCPFGAACYRTNKDHRREFRHRSRPAPKPSTSGQRGTKKRRRRKPSTSGHSSSSDDAGSPTSTTPPKRRRAAAVKKVYNDDSLEDDYDLSDPFIDDASSDAYELSNDDSDGASEWEESADEEENVGRLVKEAKRFTGKKKQHDNQKKDQEDKKNRKGKDDTDVSDT